jgi:hypothetical protein
MDGGRATVELYRPAGAAPQTKLAFTLDSPHVRTVEIWKQGKMTKRVVLDTPSALRPVTMNFDWPPGPREDHSGVPHRCARPYPAE